MAERPKFVPKPVVPEGVFDFQELLESRLRFPPTIKCPTGCARILNLSDSRVDWRAGDMRFALGYVPGYGCDSCGVTYIPGCVLDMVKYMIQEELVSLRTEGTFQLPPNIKPLD